MNKLLIQNAVIVDGTGGEPIPGDVLLMDGRIAAIGRMEAPEGCTTLDAGGRCLTPGFVDIHRHADLQALSPSFGAAELAQGITACVSGNCGMSAAPCPTGTEDALYRYLEPCLGKAPVREGFPTFTAYRERLCAMPLSLNMGAFTGNGAIRIAVKGFDPSPMTAMEMEQAKGCIAEAMDAGAMGLSLGLMYAPECNYSTEELVELARVVGRRSGIVTAHIRGEGASLPASVAEVIEIAARAEVPLHISHLKAAGHSNWGRALHRAIDLIDTARASRQDVTCDAYPYSAGSTMLLTVLPPSFLAGGVGAAMEALKQKAVRDRLQADLSQPHDDWDNLVADLGWDCVVVSAASHPDNVGIMGHSIAAIAAARGLDEVDCLCSILIAEEGRAGMVLHSMSPQDVATVLRLPYAMIVSDAIYPPSGNPHPRLYGAFPRVIREFVMEKGVLTLPQAIGKMTAMPARRVGQTDRGQVKPGYAADLLLFHPNRLLDTATYETPAQPAKGIDYAFLAGNAAIAEGAIQTGRYGAFLERQAQ